jgi:hypothetical protein
LTHLLNICAAYATCRRHAHPERPRDRRRHPTGPVHTGTIAALLTAAALLAGCGSTYTKQDFIARADAICASTLRELRSVAAQGQPAGSAAQQAGYLAAVARVVQSEASAVRSLPRPSETAGARVALSRYLDSLAQVAADFRALANAARRGDQGALANAEAALRASPVDSLAARYGLHDCATASTTAV